MADDQSMGEKIGQNALKNFEEGLTLPQAAGKAVGSAGGKVAGYEAGAFYYVGKGFGEGLKEFVQGLFSPGAPGQVPPGRVAVVWIVIITVGVIGVSGLLRPGTNVVVKMAK
jgi:hypothetical protein